MQHNDTIHEAHNIDNHYAAICAKAHDEVYKLLDELSTPNMKWIKKTEDDITIWTNPDKPNIEIRYDDAAKVHTVRFVYNPASGEPKPDWAGTDNSLVVKILDDNSYDFIRTEDLAGPGLHMIASMREKYLKEMTQEEQVAFENWLQKREAEFKANFTESSYPNNCYLDITEIKKLKSDAESSGDYSKLKAYFSERNNRVDLINKRLLANLAASLREFPQYQSHSYDKMLRDIEQTGIKRIGENGRPTIIKFGEIGEDGQKINMVSAQFPQGDQTLPSSDRLRDVDDTTLLSNHVNDFTGQVIATKGQPTKIIPDLTIDNHSSNPPIKEPDELKRRFIAFKSVEEELAKRAANIIKTSKDANSVKNNSATNPIEISISTMMLLTPWVSKGIDRFIRRGESEHGQLADTYLAYQMMRNTKQPMKIKVGNQDIYIKADLTLMNFPVNTGKKMQQLYQSKLNKQINTRGFNEYLDNVNAHLRASYVVQSDTWKNLSKALQLFDLTYLTNQLGAPNKLQPSDVLAKLSTLTHRLSVRTEALNKALKTFIENEQNKLTKHNETMKAALENYCYAANKKDKKRYEAQYRHARKHMIEIEQRIHKKEYELYKARRQTFKNEEGFCKETEKMIDILLKGLQGSNDPSSIELREHLLLQQRFIRNQRAYYNKEYLHAHNAYYFPVRYLLTNEAIKRYIVSFCKSAEDRTGFVRISLLAHLVFHHVHGRDPNFNDAKDTQIYNDIYAASAVELSASLENTMYNAGSILTGGARGHQVGEKTTGFKLAEIGKNNAGNIKKPFAELMSPALSFLKGILTGSIPANLFIKPEPDKLFNYADVKLQYVADQNSAQLITPVVSMTETATSISPPMSSPQPIITAKGYSSSQELLQSDPNHVAPAPSPSSTNSHLNQPIAQSNAQNKSIWESHIQGNMFFGKKKPVWLHYQVETPINSNQSTLHVTDSHGIKTNLMQRNFVSKISPTQTSLIHQKRLELAMTMVESVIAPLRERNFTQFSVSGDLTSEYAKLAPYIEAYCHYRKYNCQLVNTESNEKFKVIEDYVIDTIEKNPQYDKFKSPSALSTSGARIAPLVPPLDDDHHGGEHP